MSQRTAHVCCPGPGVLAPPALDAHFQKGPVVHAGLTRRKVPRLRIPQVLGVPDRWQWERHMTRGEQRAVPLLSTLSADLDSRRPPHSPRADLGVAPAAQASWRAAP